MAAEIITSTHAAANLTTSPFLQEAVAGTFAGWAQVTVGFPFDTVKVRLQTNGQWYKNAIDCCKSIVRNESFLGLYRGVNSPLMGIGICNATLFSVNANFRRMVSGGDTTRTLSLYEVGASGALTGAVMAFVNTPVELLKVQLQTQHTVNASTFKPYNGVFDAGFRMLKSRGIAGLYRGITITILRDVPSFATYFFVYEGTKQIIGNRKQGNERGNLSSLELLFAGGMAGIACWVPCYPQDVIKSRMQSDLKYKSTVECFRALIAHSRETNTSIFRAFSKGFGPTMARAFPANAATFFAYEMIVEKLR
ncbi:3882_t:CDS:2 [Acaulospora morrowiae]|uniref:3882_t:CDS:1 n=1 Tax=Acaulospora morrowiae TaxID=94023 RepID=A0A9N8W9F1_9GLOM|nr:3882_t:CDS:2 [Acaulospora morrowiae]